VFLAVAVVVRHRYEHQVVPYDRSCLVQRPASTDFGNVRSGTSVALRAVEALGGENAVAEDDGQFAGETDEVAVGRASGW
jgi:hypothetical protein